MSRSMAFLLAITTCIVSVNAADPPLKVTIEKSTASDASKFNVDLDDVLTLRIKYPEGWVRTAAFSIAAPGGQTFEAITYGSENWKTQNPLPKGLQANDTSPKTDEEDFSINMALVPKRVPGAILRVDFTYADKPANPTKSIIQSTYITIDRYRNYWAVGVIPMLSRPYDSDDAGGSLWKTGVATSIEYRTRIANSGGWGLFYNFLEPAFGAHGALLNQTTDQPVEFGLGGNISLLSGWVSGGFGYNFSGESPYYFVGINLLNLAQKFSPPGAGK